MITFLKFAFHNALTGKLSDIAICFVMPLLVSAALGSIGGVGRRWRLGIGAAVTVIVFSALEMSDWAGGWFVRAVAFVFGAQHTVLTRDPTDLLALACVPLAVAYGLRHARSAAIQSRWRRTSGALALALGALALMATSAPERCSRWSAPMAFQVEGDCGTGGIVVIQGDGYSGQLTITNQAALLAPPPNDPSGATGNTWAQTVRTRSTRGSGKSPTAPARRAGPSIQRRRRRPTPVPPPTPVPSATPVQPTTPVMRARSPTAAPPSTPVRTTRMRAHRRINGVKPATANARRRWRATDSGSPARAPTERHALPLAAHGAAMNMTRTRALTLAVFVAPIALVMLAVPACDDVPCLR